MLHARTYRSPKRESQTHIMKDRTAQEQRLLEDGCDSAVVGERSQILAEYLAAHRDRTGRQGQKACQGLQKRALPSAVRTIDADRLAGAHREIGRLKREPPIAVNTNS